MIVVELKADGDGLIEEQLEQEEQNGHGDEKQESDQFDVGVGY